MIWLGFSSAGNAGPCLAAQGQERVDDRPGVTGFKVFFTGLGFTLQAGEGRGFIGEESLFSHPPS